MRCWVLLLKQSEIHKMVFGIFKKSSNRLNNKVIFLHVPKTGGSTFVGLLKDSIKISKINKDIPTHIIDNIGNIQIKHIDFSNEERRFQCPEIFKNNVQESTKVFMLLRDPVERIISEFNFQYHLLKGKEGNKNAAIISKLKPIPNSLDKYIAFPNTQNYQTKFLLGRKIADPKKVSNDEFDLIMNGIKNIPIYCGITEEYSSFLELFQDETGLKLKKKITIRKKTPKELKLDYDETLKKKIIELNQYDYALYDFVKSKLIEKKHSTFSYDDKGFVV